MINSLPAQKSFLNSIIKRKAILLLVFISSFSNFTFSQNFSIILGRPTDQAITANILFDQNVDYYIRYGNQPGSYTDSTTILSNTANIPDEVDLQNLFADTRYFYNLLYRPTGSGAFTSTPRYTFHTQRSQGSTFSFTIEADEHLYDKKGVQSIYQINLQNQVLEQPDFMLSLGDIFGDDHDATTITNYQVDSLHLAYCPFLGSIAHSVPFYVCLGNHEGENDYYLAQTPPTNLAVYGTQARKKYYPNPYPNSFYSGNTDVEPYGIGNPENYYSWTWGNALFIVLDVYRSESDSLLAVKPTNWNWTLGVNQYNWLQNTLQNSTAQFKFVFAHHIRGQGRGGITNAQLFEWGGYESIGGNYTFATHRPGWAMPIHQLFTTYGVNVFFQGHDHLFAHEVLDSVTYQEVPMAADSTYEIGMLANANSYTADTLDGTGHLRVTVAPSCVTVDYVRAYLPADTLSGLHHNGEVAFTYSMGNCIAEVPDIQEKETVKVYPNPASTKLSIRFAENTASPIISIINTLGDTVIKTNSEDIDVSQLPAGIYLCYFSSGTTNITKKIIINH